MTSTITPSARLDEFATALDTATGPGRVPGIVAGYSPGIGQPTLWTSSGSISPDHGQRPDPDTVYDIASLTKVTATWPLVGALVDAGRVDLDRPVSDALPGLDPELPGAAVTLRKILSHTSGLRPDTRLDQYRTPAHTGISLAELICREDLPGPVGVHRYINRGFILAGLVIEAAGERPLIEQARDLWRGWGMNTITYGPLAPAADVAPTVQRFHGAPHLRGMPHDDAATLLGGVAGHAGVFSSARDLDQFATTLLRQHGTDTATGTWLTESMRPHAAIEPGLDRGLAWIVADGGRTVYHHGYTGTSLYLSPATGRHVVLCSNSVYHGEDKRHLLAPLRHLALRAVSAPVDDPRETTWPTPLPN